MEPETNITNLRLHLPERRYPNIGGQQISPSSWFVERFPAAYSNHGSPFLEMFSADQVLPVSINPDFFAAVLGGRRDLGHQTVYFEPEMQFYFKDSDSIFKSTTPEKLANLYRALLMSCAQDMPAEVHKLNLFNEFRSDRVSKAVVQRAKSILAADSSFFSATSQHQRIRGIELHERIARKFVEELLTSGPGDVLLLTEAYTAFCKLVKERELEPLKRSHFQAMLVPLIKEQHHVALRNDLKIDERQGVRGWKNLRIQDQTVLG